MPSASWLGWNLILFKSQISNRSFPASSSGAMSGGPYASEELKEETAVFEPAPSIPDSTRGGSGDCPSSSSLEAVPSVKDAMCEERSSSTGSAGPSLGTSPLSPHQAGQAGGRGCTARTCHTSPHSVLTPFV